MKEQSYSIAVKGVIFLALGGYTGEANGEKTSANTDKVITALSDYMERGNCAIVSINGELKAASISNQPVQDGKRRWYKFW